MEMHVLAPPETNVPGALLDKLSSSIRAVEQEDQDAFARIARGTRSASARPAPFCKHVGISTMVGRSHSAVNALGLAFLDTRENMSESADDV